MSEKGKTLLKGHTLSFEGAAFNPDGYCKGNPSGVGHARCSCGWLSDDFPNRAQRKRAHAQHKDEIRAAKEPR